jgi:hypothetical protein
MDNKTNEVRDDPNVHKASDVKAGETYIGKTGKYIATNGAEVNLNANGSWNWASMNDGTAPETGPTFDNNAFAASISAKGLNQLADIMQGLAYLVSGGLGAIESGGIAAAGEGSSEVGGAGVKYIGKMPDLMDIDPEQTIANDLTDLGSPRANYYNNMSVLRNALREGYEIKDASWFRANTDLDPIPGWATRTIRQSFLGAERNLLENRGLWP